jgi:hypothetical protein
MKRRYFFIAACAVVLPATACAEIYKSVDADGHVTYSSNPIKGGKKLNLEPLPTMAPGRSRPAKSANNTPGDFPRVDGATQKNRDEARRKILQDELDAEQKLLEEAQASLQEGESNLEVFRDKNGNVHRNVAKYDEKMKALAEQVALHENNIEALKTELSKIK